MATVPRPVAEIKVVPEPVTLGGVGFHYDQEVLGLPR